MATPLIGVTKAVRISDDAHTVSAREWRAVREGETHAAARTSTSNTPESFIVGDRCLRSSAGRCRHRLRDPGRASFRSMSGRRASEGTVDGNVELSAATPGGSHRQPPAPVSAAAGQASHPTSAGAGGAGAPQRRQRRGRQAGQGRRRGKGKGVSPKAGRHRLRRPRRPRHRRLGIRRTSDPEARRARRARTRRTRSSGASRHTRTRTSQTGRTARGTRPRDGSDDVVTGKGPFGRPTRPSSSDSSVELATPAPAASSSVRCAASQLTRPWQRGTAPPGPGTDPSQSGS